MNEPSIGSNDDSFDGSTSMAVVNAIASRRDEAATELPPLFEWIDPNALDALFEPTKSRGRRRGRVEFEYDGHDVVVERADGISITIDGVPELSQTAESWIDA